MASFYPRKQTTSILAICILAIALALYATRNNTTTDAKTSDTDGFVAVQSASDVASTSYSDSDWKKQFIETTNQKISLKNGTNNTNRTSLADEKLTQTDIFGRELFAKFAELRSAGLNKDQTTINAVADTAVNDTVNNIPEPKQVSLSALKIENGTPNQTSLHNYSKKLYLLLKNNLPDMNTNSVFVAVDAIENNDMTILSQIDPIISRFKNIESEMLSMSVPQSVATYHLNLLNAIIADRSNAELLRSFGTDPVGGLVAITREFTYLQDITSSVSAIEKYFSSIGINLGN